MNDQLAQFARKELKIGLARLSEVSRGRFRQMYSPGDLNLPIGEVVDRMPDDRLDWAMQQVKRTPCA